MVEVKLKDDETLGSGWWATMSGQAARSYFEAWAAVHAERACTGDPDAVPSPDSIGGSRSKPGNVADAMLKFLDVEMFLKQATPEQQRLLGYIYVQGRTWTEKVKYEFADGTDTDWMHPDTPPPTAFRTMHTDYRKRHNYDLSRFPAPEAEAYCKCWQRDKKNLLEREHLRIARMLAQAKGL